MKMKMKCVIGVFNEQYHWPGNCMTTCVLAIPYGRPLGSIEYGLSRYQLPLRFNSSIRRIDIGKGNHEDFYVVKHIAKVLHIELIAIKGG